MTGLRLESLLSDFIFEAATVEGKRVLVEEMRLAELVTGSRRHLELGKIRQQMFGRAGNATVHGLILRVLRLFLVAVLHDRGILREVHLTVTVFEDLLDLRVTRAVLDVRFFDRVRRLLISVRGEKLNLFGLILCGIECTQLLLHRHLL